MEKFDKGISIILRDGGTYTINKKQLEYWSFLFDKVNVYEEVLNLKELWKYEKLPRKTSRNIHKYIVKHLIAINKEVINERLDWEQ